MALKVLIPPSLTTINLQRIIYHNWDFFMANLKNNSEDIKILSTRLFAAEEKLKSVQQEINELKSHIIALQKKSGIRVPLKTKFLGLSSIESNKASGQNDQVDSADGEDFDNSQPHKKFKAGLTMEDDHVVVYTDGACENNGKQNAKAGIGVWFGENSALNVSEPVRGKATNNVAEIQAIISAVDVAHENGIKQLTIKTDSQFVYNSMNNWIKRWKKNNWKTASGGDVKNKEDFIVLDNCLKKLDSVRWEHVNGHCGIRGNEEADKLARQGAVRYRPM